MTALNNGSLGNSTEAARLRRQRAILCRFGESALRAHDLDTLLGQACEAVSEAIDVRLVKVLELLPEENKMLVRAGVGWKPGVVGHATFGADEKSPSGYALKSGEPVISDDLANEERFQIPDVLREHGVSSMVNVAVAGKHGPWGVLEVDSASGQQFDQDDVEFLHNYAHLIAAAIEGVLANQERGRLSEQNRILLEETRHRVTNLLANIRALVALTRSATTDLAGFVEAFDSRLEALARTQDLLFGRPDRDVSLHDLLRLELEAHGQRDGGRLALNGPKVMLPAECMRALGMTFHELATNATKYGAFGVEGGGLEVFWALDPAERQDALLIRWRETGVPIPSAPEHRGLGFRMIENSVRLMCDGTSSITFHADGIECMLRIPLTKGSPTGLPSSPGAESGPSI